MAAEGLVDRADGPARSTAADRVRSGALHNADDWDNLPNRRGQEKLVGGLDVRKVMRSMELTARYIIPHFKNEPAGVSAATASG